MNKWTRKQIIQSILQREKDGLPLNLGGTDRVNLALYQAGSRIFGSWGNAIEAAGISSERKIYGKQWPPPRILGAIRTLARRKRPPSVTQLETRKPALVAAARRTFGSWSRAVIAAGCDPTRFQRVRPWTAERIVEAILVRAIRCEPLNARGTQPRSLVEAAQRVFGSWNAAKEAAGVDLRLQNGVPAASPRVAVRRIDHKHWTDAAIIERIHARFKDRKQVNASTVRNDDKVLHRVARRRFGNWGKALAAAGFTPDGPIGLTRNAV